MPYGFMIREDGTVTIHESEATVVKKVYQRYLSGDSLGKIVDQLKEEQLPSPSGDDNWIRATVDKLLSNGKYVPFIINMDEFTRAKLIVPYQFRFARMHIQCPIYASFAPFLCP